MIMKSISQIFLIINMFVKINTQNALQPKVVDGQTIPITRYPHVAFLKVKMSRGCHSICGSSVLNQFILVTAAHCLDEVTQRHKMTAYAGNENIDEANVVRLVKKTYVHEDYNEYKMHSFNDIALLQVKTALPLNQNIQRIIVVKTFPRVAQAYLAGWGLVDDEEEVRSFWLQSISQDVQDPQMCALQIGRRLPGSFCAGSKHNKDPRPASGDSGSGLITRNRELIGILSFKSQRFPALPYYTNVTYFYPWLLEKTKEALSQICP